MQEIEHWTLPNGIRVIHKQINSDVAHCGLMINAGTRDESEAEHGIAHFIEHCLFKGTTKRKPYHILTRIEDVGGELNAYTSKEETCVYATFLNDYYKRATELISDIVFNSVFPEKEIEKERTVIADEIYAYKDNPAEEIYDRFEELIFPDHPIGRDILGTEAHLKSFTRLHIQQFISRCYNTDEIVFSSIGNIATAALKKITEKTLGKIPENLRKYKRTAPKAYESKDLLYRKNVYQTHVIMGGRAYSAQEKKRTGLIVLNNLLGGPGMSSRLNLAVREKFGLTYQLDSQYQIYSDCGLWNIYMGTEKDSMHRSVELCMKELKKLRKEKLSILQLHKAKQQIIGQIAISQENHNALMLSFAKSFMHFNKVDSFKETVDKIHKITANELLAIANEIYDEDQMCVLTYLP
jgi:predicted Zn-dependent peptidase